MIQSRGYQSTYFNLYDLNIKAAINTLLLRGATQVNNHNVKLIECSPNIDVVMNKKGGICTKCNAMFKSKISLQGHLEKCGME
jgi:hypothetical protein